VTPAVPDTVLAGDVWGEARRPSPARIAVDVVGAGVFTLLVGLVEASVSTTSLIATLLLGLALSLRQAWLPGMVGAAVAASVVQLVGSQVAVFGDLNSWSLHAIYRARLSDAFDLERVPAPHGGTASRATGAASQHAGASPGAASRAASPASRGAGAPPGRAGSPRAAPAPRPTAPFAWNRAAGLDSRITV